MQILMNYLGLRLHLKTLLVLLNNFRRNGCWLNSEEKSFLTWYVIFGPSKTLLTLANYIEHSGYLLAVGKRFK